MALTKQARILSEKQERVALHYLKATEHPERNTVLFLMSVKAGLRAKEIASLTWNMIIDSDGQVGEAIHLVNQASKGAQGGRIIPLNSQLRQAIVQLYEKSPPLHFERPVILSRLNSNFSAQTIVNWFSLLYKELGFQNCSSHSGRRTFVTRAAKNVVRAGGSLRDVQQLAGHMSLQTTQRYIEGDTEAKKKLVNLV